MDKFCIKLIRVRLELTTLALSAPRSADWANGPHAREVILDAVKKDRRLMDELINK